MSMNRRHFLAAAGLPALLSFSGQAVAAEEDFGKWLADLRVEAGQRGFSKRTIDDALTGLSPIQRVIELDRRQPESTITFDTYLTRVVNDARIANARQQLRDNAPLLDQVVKRFGVQPRFIVSLWAVETNFGQNMGGFPVVQALATLAFEGRRAEFFRTELFNALRVIERTGISSRDMKGSWAGAMGQSQFMPSSYLAYAFDFDGDGKADIWNTRADVFASISNYLSKVGWKSDETWGRAVKLTSPLEPTMIDDRRLQGRARPLSEWQTLGVRRADGGPLPARDIPAWLVQPGGKDGPNYLVYSNYRSLLHWNRSLFFATSVGYLSDRIQDEA